MGGKDCGTKQNENKKQCPLKFSECLELHSITKNGAWTQINLESIDSNRLKDILWDWKKAKVIKSLKSKFLPAHAKVFE